MLFGIWFTFALLDMSSFECLLALALFRHFNCNNSDRMQTDSLISMREKVRLRAVLAAARKPDVEISELLCHKL